MQKAFYNALLSTIPPAFENVFARRFKVLEIPSLHIEPFKISRIKHFAVELQSMYSKLPYGVPMIMLRTWSNGWFTTHQTLRFLAFMDVVGQILCSTTCNVSICGPLFVPVQTVPRVLFPHPWPRESALLIQLVPTFLGVW